jgi:hypothetical protein
MNADNALRDGMVFCMATRKITITLEDHQIDEIRALVGAGEAANVSGADTILAPRHRRSSGKGRRKAA